MLTWSQDMYPLPALHTGRAVSTEVQLGGVGTALPPVLPFPEARC